MTDFYVCECGMEAISVANWGDDEYGPLIGLSMWRIGGTVRYRLRDKLSLIWHIIQYGHPWTDDVLLDEGKARELAGKIMEIVGEESGL